MVKNILIFFDKLEDRIRARLSRHPIPYAIIGGVGIVLFWRSVWQIADRIPFLSGSNGEIAALIISVIILLGTGLFVSFFISNRIILSGIMQEKKLTERTHGDVLKSERTEIDLLKDIESRIQKIEQEVGHLENDHHQA